MKLSEIKYQYDRTILLQEELEERLSLLYDKLKYVRKYNPKTRKQEEIYTTERLKLLRELQELQEQASDLDNQRNYSLIRAVEALSKGVDNE
jgi:uncharacterized protein YlxW (UPF0749 family)